MTVPYRFTIPRRTRLGQWLSLIFFVYLLAESCRQKEAAISIVWEGKKATGIVIPNQLLGDGFDEPPTNLQVRRKGNADAMLGNYEMRDGHTGFTPLIPLTSGDEYEVLYKNKLIGSIQIPAANAATAAYIVNLFPAIDTMPMNLLKIYIQFSAPMRQGEAIQRIYLLNEHNDTVPDVFLDLQPELWDSAGKTLTMWLDPGRIKRDLIPNRKLGNPLQQGKHYTIYISNNWRDVQGLPLQQEAFTRLFTAGPRDSISPQPQLWKLALPLANTTDGIDINFGEPLDYYLISETIHILDEKGNVITGKSGALTNATGFTFWPGQPWKAGRYHIQVASYLEDLAGNNLNRLFDRDLQVKKVKSDEEFMEREFVIK